MIKFFPKIRLGMLMNIKFIKNHIGVDLNLVQYGMHIDGFPLIQA